MKNLGIVRKVDELGRVVIPVEMRRVLGINIKDPLEIFVKDGEITLKRFEQDNRCLVTGEVTPQNKRYAEGLILSPVGAKLLFNQIREDWDI
ncbi:AbrB family transcriptional regulator [Priestia aryabhattai]|uniref:AbrB/MazE/SpoVT family DNA-binding domain-containing protein n=1 Tax=Bacillaceae TaxID=186817 RepID=UPI000BA04264|nr:MULTISPECIES: AbrB/MazE/SpoVT family DNA-binding domain-containing protein [Bacillaceae]MDT2046595.1 AbrB/MazE/SpoVT family DNA-binding domain-containing protein [Priestia flexa]OZT13689.1 AbrB family transcriptional regulator [Priestia aryabhattai]TDB49737.1 AbrB/MazE/SpoVT family DNA-binding domain-containing protein [Bacillus sp. CBEL-1]USY53396.1 AbrB/MazE/SpoVT family DNA-binding domain-containing protein [Bacillus sp. 1780r2a1]